MSLAALRSNPRSTQQPSRRSRRADHPGGTTMIRHRRLPILIVAVAVLGIGGCSLSAGDDTDEPASNGGTVEGADIDFGDDASMWANDGECDDPRFEGEGTHGILLDEDRGHDATDCRELLEDGKITYVGD
ncbi:MAG: hypothetical protein U5R31_14925 [Acidimicrobiia bacterium]|nr:hypothetical protein [Acidimicrobiia bacterium]